MSIKSRRMFDNQVRRANYSPALVWECSTAQRKTKILPIGVFGYDTDLKQVFIGDGAQVGGVSAAGNREVRSVTNAAASAFTSADTFKTIASSASGVFTSNAHGFAVGTVITALATQAGYKLVDATNYTVATVPTVDTFTLTGVTPDDTTANVVVKLYSVANNNYITWAEGAYLRTGDGITFTDNGGTLPSGISTATEYFVVKADSDANGGSDRNVLTKFRLSDSRAHALAGTNINVIKTAGTGAFRAVTTDMYATGVEDVVVITAAVAVSFYLPAAGPTGKQYTVNNPGAANVTVKSVSGTVDAAIAATGKVLKASSNDFVSLVDNGTNYIAVAKQITP